MNPEIPPPSDSTARQGKVARLPYAIREEINRRIRNAETAKNIVDWLNSLPETQVVVQAQFDGQPISESNLYRWKAGGYRDWEAKQEALDLARSFCADGAELKDADSLNDNLAFRAAAQIAVILRNYVPTADPERQLESLALLCRQIFRLRRGDHDAKWLQIERERLALDVQKFQEQCARANKSPGPKLDAVTTEDFKLMEQRDNL
jgi:hypothetical protein